MELQSMRVWSSSSGVNGTKELCDLREFLLASGPSTE